MTNPGIKKTENRKSGMTTGHNNVILTKRYKQIKKSSPKKLKKTDNRVNEGIKKLEKI